MPKTPALAEPLVIGGIVSGTSFFWLLTANLGALDFLRCGLVLAAYIVALAGLVSLLRGCGLDFTFASAITGVAGIAWLTWPVWLDLYLLGSHAETIVYWLTSAHPLMALNGVLFDRFNSWDRYTLAYQQLTLLNQDVFYTLPRHVTACVLFHGTLGAGGMMLPMALSSLRSRGRKRIV